MYIICIIITHPLLFVLYQTSGPVANKLIRPRNTCADSWCAWNASPSKFQTLSLPEEVNVKAGVCIHDMKYLQVRRCRLQKRNEACFVKSYLVVFHKLEIKRISSFLGKLCKMPVSCIKGFNMNSHRTDRRSKISSGPGIKTLYVYLSKIVTTL